MIKTRSLVKFDEVFAEAEICLRTFRLAKQDLVLRYVWISTVSSLDHYLTELIIERNVQLLGSEPPEVRGKVGNSQVPLSEFLSLADFTPMARLRFSVSVVSRSVRFRSFHRSESVSEALSYIWKIPSKQRWAEILGEMKKDAEFAEYSESNVRDELNLIADRRDQIAHSADIKISDGSRNSVRRSDAEKVIRFIKTFVYAIDEITSRDAQEEEFAPHAD